jgi:predicted MFS family arabinose efflux permease
VPNLVPRADLANAFSVQSIAFDLGSIFGPMLSGLVIASLGLQAVYLINAISFGAVILALIFMGPVAQTGTPETNGERRAVSWAAIKEGIQYILHQPIILSSMLLDFWATFFSSANTLLPFVAIDILHVGEVEYGWLSAAQSIGAVSAALVISQRHGLRRQGSLLLGAVMLFGAATILFGVSRVFWLTMLALVLVGAADSVSTILRNTIRQIQTPDHLRGRMVSVNQIFFMGGPQLGEIESGLVAQAFGVPAAIISGGVGCILAAGWIGARWKQLRRYDGAEHASVPAPAS